MISWNPTENWLILAADTTQCLVGCEHTYINSSLWVLLTRSDWRRKGETRTNRKQQQHQQRSHKKRNTRLLWAEEQEQWPSSFVPNTATEPKKSILLNRTAADEDRRSVASLLMRSTLRRRDKRHDDVLRDARHRTDVDEWLRAKKEYDEYTVVTMQDDVRKRTIF